jgi:hypothetical protein
MRDSFSTSAIAAGVVPVIRISALICSGCMFGGNLWFRKKRFNVNRIIQFKLNQKEFFVKKSLKTNPADMTASRVDAQITRIQRALGDDWMSRMDVAIETVRTWRKRGSIPITQLSKASDQSGRPMEWFKLDQLTAASTATSPIRAKQGTPIGDQIPETIDAGVLARVLALVDTELEEMGLVLPAPKKAQLVILIYEKFMQMTTASDAKKELESVKQHLRLVA